MQTKTKHTPLPWTIEKTDNRYPVGDDRTPWNIEYKHDNSGLFNERVCTMTDGAKHEWQDNAEFIVTACNSHYELLEALKAMLAASGLRPGNEVLLAEAAIAKATGGE